VNFDNVFNFQTALCRFVADIRQKDFAKNRKQLRADSETLLKKWSALTGEDLERLEGEIKVILESRDWGGDDALNEIAPGSVSMRL
jgi:hypothetical protein